MKVKGNSKVATTLWTWLAVVLVCGASVHGAEAKPRTASGALAATFALGPVAGSTDALEFTITPEGGSIAYNAVIEVTLPSGFVEVSAVSWMPVADVDAGIVALPGTMATATETGETTYQFELNSDDITQPLHAGTEYGFHLLGFQYPLVSGTVPGVVVTVRNNDGAVLCSATTNAVVLDPAPFVASPLPVVTLSSLTASTGVTAAVEFTPSVDIPAGGSVSVTFGPAFAVETTMVVQPPTSGSSLPGFSGVVVGDKTVEVMLSAPLSSGVAYGFDIDGITTPVAGGLNDDYLVQAMREDGRVLNSDLTPGHTFIPNFASVSVSTDVTPLTMGAPDGELVVRFKPTVGLVIFDTVVVLLPSGFAENTASATVGAVAGAAELPGGSSISHSGNAVTVTLGGSVLPDTEYAFVVSSIQFPEVAGKTGMFSVYTSASGGQRNRDDEIPGLVVSPSGLLLTVSDEMPQGGAENTLSLTFEPSISVTSGKYLWVTLPGGYGAPTTVSPTGFTLGADPLMVVSETASAVVLAVGPLTSGLTASVEYTLELEDVTNPTGVLGFSGTVSLEVRSGTENDAYGYAPTINTGSASDALWVVAPLVSASVSLDSYLNEEALANVTLSVRLANAMGAGDYIRVTVPAPFPLRADAVVLSSSMGSPWHVNVTGQYVDIVVPPLATGVTHTLVLSGVGTPRDTGATDPWLVETIAKASGEVRNMEAWVTGPVIQPRGLVAVNATAGVHVPAGSLRCLGILFRPEIDIALTDELVITADPSDGFFFTDSAYATLASGCFANELPGTVVWGDAPSLSKESANEFRLGAAGTAAAMTAGELYFVLLEDVKMPLVGDRTTMPLKVTVESSTGAVLQTGYSESGLTLLPATLDGPIAVSSQHNTVGASGAFYVSWGFGADYSVPLDGVVVLTLPADYDLSGTSVVHPKSWSEELDEPVLFYEATVDSSANTVTLQLKTFPLSPYQLYGVLLEGVRNPMSNGTYGPFGVTMYDGNNGKMFMDSGGSHLVVGALTGVSVSPDTAVQASGVSLEVMFTTPVMWIEAGGSSRLDLVFPDTFDLFVVSSPGVVDLGGSTNFPFSAPAVTISGNTFQVAGLEVLPETTYTFSVTGLDLSNPAVSEGSTGKFEVHLYNDAGTHEAGKVEVAGYALTPAPLTLASVEPVELAQSHRGWVLVTLRPSQNVPANGIIHIDFPSGFSVASDAHAISGPSTDLPVPPVSVSSSGQRVSVALDLSTADPAERELSSLITYSFLINGVRNPSATGTTGTFTVSTSVPEEGVLEVSSGVPGVTIHGRLSDVSVVPANAVTGATTTAVVAFTTRNSVPAGGAIKVRFDDAFLATSDVLSVVSSSLGAALPGSPAISAVTPDVTVTLTVGLSANTRYAFKINKVRLPLSSGTSAPYKVWTTNAGGDEINGQPNTAGTMIYPSALDGVVVTPDVLTTRIEPLPSNVGYTIHLSPTLAVPSSGFLTVVLPAGVEVDSPTPSLFCRSTATETSICGSLASVGDVDFDADAGLWSVAVEVTSELAADPSLPYAFTIDGVLNPHVAGRSGSYVVQTQDADGTVQQETTVDGTVFEPAPFRHAAVSPVALVANKVTSIRVMVEAEGDADKLRIHLPSGFQALEDQVAVGVIDSCFLPPDEGPAAAALAKDFCKMGGASVSVAEILVSEDGQTVTLCFGSLGLEAGDELLLTVEGVMNPASGTTGQFAVESLTRDGQLVNSKVTPGVRIYRPLGSVSLSLRSLSTAQLGMAEVSFSVSEAMAAGSAVMVAFPDSFEVSTTRVEGDGNSATAYLPGVASLSVSDGTVVIELSGGLEAGTVYGFAIDGITNPYFEGETGPFSVAVLTSAEALGEEQPEVADVGGFSDDVPSVVIVPSLIGAATASADYLVLGVPSRGFTVTFVTPVDLMDVDVDVWFPAAYDLGLDALDRITTDMACTPTVNMATDENGSAYTVVGCSIGYVGGASAGSELMVSVEGLVLGDAESALVVTIRYYGEHLVAHAPEVAPPEVDAAPASFPVSLTVETASVDTTTDLVFEFVPPTTWASNVMLWVMLPRSYDASSAGLDVARDPAQALPSASLDSTDTHMVAIQIAEDLLVGGTTYGFVLTNVETPAWSGATSDFVVAVTADADSPPMALAQIAGSWIAPESMDLDVSLASSLSGLTTIATFSITPQASLPHGTNLEFVLPASYGLGEDASVIDGCGSSFSFYPMPIEDNRYTVTLTSALVAGSTYCIAIDDVRLPILESTGAGGAFAAHSYAAFEPAFELRKITTTTDGENPIIEVPESSFASASVALGGLSTTSILTTLQFSLTITRDVLQSRGDTLVIQLPLGMEVRSGAPSVWGVSGGVPEMTAVRDPDMRTLTLSFSGGSGTDALEALAGASTYVFQISDIYTVTESTTTDPFFVASLEAGATIIEGALVSGLLINTAPLEAVEVSLEAAVVTVTGEATVLLRPAHDIPEGGTIEVTWPAGFGVASDQQLPSEAEDASALPGNPVVSHRLQSVIITLDSLVPEFGLEAGTLYGMRVNKITAPEWAITSNSTAIVSVGLFNSEDDLVNYMAVASPTVVQPAVVESSPAANDTSVDTTTSISITWSTAMDTNATQNAFTLVAVARLVVGATANSAVPVDGVFEWHDNATRMVFVPDAALVGGSEYQIAISSSARDVNAVEATPYTANFVTAPGVGQSQSETSVWRWLGPTIGAVVIVVVLAVVVVGVVTGWKIWHRDASASASGKVTPIAAVVPAGAGTGGARGHGRRGRGRGRRDRRHRRDAESGELFAPIEPPMP